ncbi:hypothetical protein BGZ75_003210, partial [Mortierella antarctica]
LEQLLGEDEDDDELEEEEVVAKPVCSTAMEIDKVCPEQKESSRARLRALQSILKMLLESPRLQETVNGEWVRKSGFAKEEITDLECEVVADLTNKLRPYIPKRQGQGGKDKPIAHVAIRAQFVLIANSIVRAAGYPDFSRQISPQ